MLVDLVHGLQVANKTCLPLANPEHGNSYFAFTKKYQAISIILRPAQKIEKGKAVRQT